jgi:hypothetical protein
VALKWKDSIEMNPKEEGYKSGDSIYLIPNRVPWWILANMVIKL